ncbi:hypothetical protein GQ53DRAFT_747721 [Thozetella sp. PMI_491]|nr:hypothetical protein GQ53DRAFT_747721 [Thozetella sp. PMI_491]
MSALWMVRQAPLATGNGPAPLLQKIASEGEGPRGLLTPSIRGARPSLPRNQPTSSSSVLVATLQWTAARLAFVPRMGAENWKPREQADDTAQPGRLSRNTRSPGPQNVHHRVISNLSPGGYRTY